MPSVIINTYHEQPLVERDSLQLEWLKLQSFLFSNCDMFTRLTEPLVVDFQLLISQIK